MSEGKERMILKMCKHVNYDNIAQAATNGLKAAANLVNDVALTLTTQPDIPRNITLTIVDTTASIVDGDVVITGIDVNGNPTQETIDCASGAGTKTGNVPFAIVTSVLPTGFTVLGGSGDETMGIGMGDKLGLPTGPNGKLLEVIKACAAGANETIGTVSRTYSTIDPTTATDGSADFDFWYVCEIALL